MEIGEGRTPLGPGPRRDQRNVRIRISLFFDGTRNSRRNVEVRQFAKGKEPDPVLGYGTLDQVDASTEDERRAKLEARRAEAERIYEHAGGGENGETSYENDHSNVSRLEANLAEVARADFYHLKVYTEGIGTTDDEKDSTWGYAAGTGATGIPRKVTKALAAAMERFSRLNRLRLDGVFIERITVDTCGFSRGAAAARHCVDRVLRNQPFEMDGTSSVRLKEQLEGLGWDVGVVQVCAVGLFDTVASFGLDLSANYASNTRKLRLDAIRDAQAVYQIAAAEEYRIRFSLTNIESAGGNGRQVYLPGAHSDIGGSYTDAGEHKPLISGAAVPDVEQFLVDRGWYRTGPPVSHPELRSVFSFPRGLRLLADRDMIRRTYTFVPMRCMAKFLRVWGLPLSPAVELLYDPGSFPALDRLVQYAERIGFPGTAAPDRPSDHSDWEDNVFDDVKALRNEYLHISFNDKAFAFFGARLLRPDQSPDARFRPTRRRNWG